MITTVMLLVILSAIAAAVPLLAMYRYDAAIEPDARELIGKVPITHGAAGYGSAVEEVSSRTDAQRRLIEEQLGELQRLERQLLELQEKSIDPRAALEELHERIGKDRARLNEELKAVTLQSEVPARNVLRRST